MAGQRPNILIFFTDQQRWDTVGAYGRCPLDLTPNLDRMAREGVRFEYAFTPQPVCGPARSCIQTGLYATQTGVFRNYGTFNPECKTIANYLGDAGYDLGYIGKWHMGRTRENPVPLEQRFGWNALWEAADALEHTSHPYEGHMFDASERSLEFKDQYRTDFLTERAIRFMRQDRGGKPFCLMVSYLEPHQQNDWGRFAAPEEYADRIRRHPFGPWVPEDLRGTPGDWEAELPDYLGMVKKLDENLGELLTELGNLGVRENTLVLFIADHGCHFKTRNGEYKRSAHDSSVRIPFVLHGPGFRGGVVSQGLVSLIDIAPTLLEAAGLEVPGQMRGRSLFPLASGEPEDWRQEVFIQVSESMVARAFRTKRWTYCVYAPDGRGGEDPGAETYLEYQLYDNFADPHQRVNLIGRDPYRQVAEELRVRLLCLMKEAGEPGPNILPATVYP
jgi:arylsulfatase A-like enzyme